MSPPEEVGGEGQGIGVPLGCVFHTLSISPSSTEGEGIGHMASGGVTLGTVPGGTHVWGRGRGPARLLRPSLPSTCLRASVQHAAQMEQKQNDTENKKVHGDVVKYGSVIQVRPTDIAPWRRWAGVGVGGSWHALWGLCPQRVARGLSP